MSNTLRPNGERQEPSWKSSNRRSTSRRRLSNGRHSAGRSAFSSFPTGSFVAVSAMSLLLTFAHLEGDLGGDADSFLFRCGVHDSPQLVTSITDASAWSCASALSTTVITFVIITSAAFMVLCAKSFYRSQANSLI